MMIDQPATDPRALLAAAVQAQVDQDTAHTRLLITAADWADAHPLLDDEGPFADTGLRLNSDGVPTVACSAVAELAAALHMSSAAGEYLVAAALELRHRLPRIWLGLLAGEIRPGRARMIADRTLTLSKAAADHVDRHLCHLADQISAAQIDRTILDAVLRHMPEKTAEQAERRKDPRGVWFAHDAGTADTAPHTRLSASLDVHDGLQLESVIDADATRLRRLGVGGHDQILRAMALGDLARCQPTLAADGEEVVRAGDSAAGPGSSDRGGTADPTSANGIGAAHHDRQARPARPVTLFLHLHADTITTGHGIGRIDGLQAPVELDQITDWLTAIGAQVTVKPVIDLNEPVVVDAYEIPERIRERVLLREPGCVYPWCDKPSTAPGVDLDHIVPFSQGGRTSTENLAPLCRTHHRFKTHTGWHYRRLFDGTYEWTSPYGFTYRRERDGTISDADRPPPAPIGEAPQPAPPGPRRRPKRVIIDDCCAPARVPDLTPAPF